MARDSAQQREIKIEALKKAIKDLRGKSTPSKNLVTYQNVVNLANEQNAKKFERPINVASIKVPKSEEFREIKRRLSNG